MENNQNPQNVKIENQPQVDGFDNVEKNTDSTMVQYKQPCYDNQGKLLVATDKSADYFKKTTTTTQSTTLEQASEKKFISKRNVIIMTVSLVISIALLMVTIFAVLKIDWANFFHNVGQSFFTVQLWWLWLFVMIAFMVCMVVYNYFPIWVRFKALGIKVPAWQYFTFSITISFLKATTPANFIYDPYTVFWMKTQGVSTSRASSIMLCHALLWQIVQFIIHIPSYVVIMLARNQLADGPRQAIIFFMTLGFLIDIISLIIMIPVCFSKHFHYRMSRIFNWLKMKLHLKYHTKEESAVKYMSKAIVRKDIIEYFKDWKSTLIVVGVFAAYEILLYFAVGFAMAWINSENIPFNFVNVYHCANMAFCANRINIIPGLGVGLEACLAYMLDALTVGESGVDKTFISNGLFVWRFFYTYVPAFVGFFGMLVLVTNQVKSAKKGHLFKK